SVGLGVVVFSGCGGRLSLTPRTASGLVLPISIGTAVWIQYEHAEGLVDGPNQRFGSGTADRVSVIGIDSEANAVGGPALVVMVVGSTARIATVVDDRCSGAHLAALQ